MVAFWSKKVAMQFELVYIYTAKNFTMQLQIPFQYSLWIFFTAVVLLWFFSGKLSGIVNYIDAQWKLGSSFGGTLILSVVTNLPEIAITINGALRGDVTLAVGNILGGILMQSVLLIVFDFASRKEKKPLSTLVSDPASIIQGLALIIILVLVILGKQLSPSSVLYRTTAPEILIALAFIGSIFVLKKVQPKGQDASGENKNEKKSKLTPKSSLIWLIGISVIILILVWRWKKPAA